MKVKREKISKNVYSEVLVELHPKEKHALKQMARNSGVTVGSFVRAALGQYLVQPKSNQGSNLEVIRPAISSGNRKMTMRFE